MYDYALSVRDVNAMVGGSDTWGFAYFGHGPLLALHRGTGWRIAAPRRFTPQYGLAAVVIASCGSFDAGYSDWVSPYGLFGGVQGLVSVGNLYNSLQSRTGTHTP